MLKEGKFNFSLKLNSKIIKDSYIELEPNDIRGKNSIMSMTKDKVITKMDNKETNTYKGIIDNDKNQ